MLGVARAHQPQADDWLAHIQSQLFHLGADLATPLDAKADWVVRVDATAVNWLESRIDEMTAELPPLSNLHPARRHSRSSPPACSPHRFVAAPNDWPSPWPGSNPSANTPIPYLNRLSDLLFTLARWENMKANISENSLGCALMTNH